MLELHPDFHTTVRNYIERIGACVNPEYRFNNSLGNLRTGCRSSEAGYWIHHGGKGRTVHKKPN
jgi:hypothetical protein